MKRTYPFLLLIFCALSSSLQAQSANWGLKLEQTGNGTNLLLERGLVGPQTLSLGYGLFYGAYPKSYGIYINSNVEQYSLQYTRFLLGEKFQDGLSLKLNVNYLVMGSNNKVLYVENKQKRKIISAGEKKMAHGLSLGYEWYWPSSFHLGLHSGIYQVGDIHTWLPFALSLGFIF